MRTYDVYEHEGCPPRVIYITMCALRLCCSLCSTLQCVPSASVAPCALHYNVCPPPLLLLVLYITMCALRFCCSVCSTLQCVPSASAAPCALHRNVCPPSLLLLVPLAKAKRMSVYTINIPHNDTWLYDVFVCLYHTYTTSDAGTAVGVQARCA